MSPKPVYSCSWDSFLKNEFDITETNRPVYVAGKKQVRPGDQQERSLYRDRRDLCQGVHVCVYVCVCVCVVLQVAMKESDIVFHWPTITPHPH